MVSPFLKQQWNHYKGRVFPAAQWWVASGVLSNVVGLGMVLSYPACLLPGLRAPGQPAPAADRGSLLASCIGMSSCVGFFGSSFLMEAYGRKWTHAAIIVPGLAGWLIISVAGGFPALLLGRLLCGVTGGGTVSLGAIVIGEYSSPGNRGLFLTLKTAATCVGALIMHVLANYFSWRTVALISLVPLVIAFCNILTWPESPSWLASKSKFEECERSFFWLRGKGEESVKELLAMTQAQKKRAECTSEMSCVETVKNFVKKFGRKDFILPVLVIFFSFILLEACGRHVFPAYALEIISDIRGDRSQTFIYTLCMDLIITGSATFSCVLVKLMNRRSLLFFSGISSMVVLLAVSLYLYLTSKGIVANDKPWIPTSMLVVYFVTSNLGCTSIPLVLLGEIFPLPHRAAGTSVSGLTMSFVLALALQTTPKMMSTISVHGTFAVFALFIGLSLLVLYFILPETKNKTLQEIEDYFNHGKFHDGEDKVNNDEVTKKMLHEEAQRNNTISEHNEEAQRNNTISEHNFTKSV